MYMGACMCEAERKREIERQGDRETASTGNLLF